MPLAEIRSFLAAPSVAALDAFARRLRRELRDRTEVLAGPPRELYLDGRREGSRMEVAWPVR